MSDPVIARLAASPPRRYSGLFMLGGLGVLLVALAVRLPFGAGQITLAVIGLLSLVLAQRLFQHSGQVLELTRHALQVQGGAVLAEVAQMQKVERGAFAFKPSNGFLLTLTGPMPRSWAPGLYWSFGRRLGIGGITGAPQSKAMAEAIASLIAERDMGPPEA